VLPHLFAGDHRRGRSTGRRGLRPSPNPSRHPGPSYHSINCSIQHHMHF
jgi:hypothetical protein